MLFKEPNTTYSYVDRDGKPFRTFRDFFNYHYSFPKFCEQWLIAEALFDAFIAWVDKDNLKEPPLCEGCGKEPSDPPSTLCPGCQAYKEHNMTDRYSSLTVVLDRDIREDDAESIINAILHIKGVIRVEGNVSDINELVARSRVKREVAEKLRDIIESILRG